MTELSVRVLLVEDDPSARMVLEALFQQWEGLTLCGAARDGIEGLELLEREEPDVVILDLIMPGLDGVGFLCALQEAELPRRPAVLVTSRVGSPNMIEYALSLGADYYLMKPLNFQALPGLLRALHLRPLVRRAAECLAEMGGSGLGLEAAAAAAAALARDREGTMLLKQAYAGFIAQRRSSYQCVEKNIRDMVRQMAAQDRPAYRALMAGVEGRPSNSVFLRRLAERLKEAL